MTKKDEKWIRLAQVARMYYLEDCKQSDIAKEMNVSRPFVSRMLKDARDQGVVEITIREHEDSNQKYLAILQEKYHLKGGVLVADEDNGHLTNQRLAHGAIGLLRTLKTRRLGLGWGHFIAEMVQYLETTQDDIPTVAAVCPMIGNSGIPMRHYQSSESVRVFAECLKASPHFLNLPALPGDITEKKIFCGTESYRQILQQWERMDTAFVNIGNHPSTPDFASGARYGIKLQQEHACGRVACYFFNRTGSIIYSDQDFALQIPLDILRKCRYVVGLCSANTNAVALEGALNTGLFTHLVARQELAKKIV